MWNSDSEGIYGGLNSARSSRNPTPNVQTNLTEAMNKDLDPSIEIGYKITYTYSVEHNTVLF